jgi:hypothetical protein
MNDRDPFDTHDSHLSERMERAVGGLRGPDVLPRAMARGRRLRTRRRLTYAAGGLAAATALALTVPTLATAWDGREQDPSGPPVAADPSGTSSTTAASGDGPSGSGSCDTSATGWWSKPAAQVEADLSALLPAGTQIGETDTDAVATWGGNLVTGDDADFAAFTLLPPPGVPGPRRTLAEASDLGPCGGANEPMQAVKPCDELTGHVACEEIRSEDGTIVGVVTERAEQGVVDGQEQPTDRTYVLATLAVPDGGHVELYVSEGTRADLPDTVHDPADVPALTVSQVREIITAPAWTS